MNRGGMTALLLAGVALNGCATGTRHVEIRPMSSSAAILAKGGDDLAVAKGQLALGNVGLALEAFRKLQRLRPADPAPLEGISDCYAAMSRFDLAQANQEAALALAPRDPRLLAGLARIFELSGRPGLAAMTRAEANAALPAPAASITVPLPPVETVVAPAPPPPSAAAVAVETPPPVAVAEAQIPPPDVTDASITLVLPEAVSAPESTALPNVAGTSMVLEALPEEPAIPLPAIVAAPVTIDLPAMVRVLDAPAPLPMPALAEAAPEPVAPAPAPLAPPPAKRVREDVALQDARPRLERIAPGEVALITTGRPLWRAPAGVRVASVAAVKWIPLNLIRTAANVRILNAARSQGLAASARTILQDRGWRKIDIGDAPATHQASVVLYPKERAGLARRLAVQFGIQKRVIAGTTVVLVLGKDRAATIRGKRQT